MIRSGLGLLSLRSRSGAIAALLLFTLAGTLVTGWEARRAAAAERRTAEGVLRDYARFAATEYVRVASGQLHSAAEMTLANISCASSRGILSSALLPLPADHCDCVAPIGPVRTVLVKTASGGWEVVGAPIGDGIRSLLRDADRKPLTEQVQIRVVPLGKETVVVGWREKRGPGQGGEGFVADLQSLQAIFARAAKSSLLPATLLSSEEAAALLALRVSTPEVVDVFANEITGSQFSSKAMFANALGGFAVTASLSPAAAQKLVIGGLPTSRMPLVYGMTIICVVLMILAAVQLIREGALARQRTEFVAGVSHELRTPLTQIRMFAETLSLGRVRSSEEQQESLDIIVREAQRLSHLVDKVLSFSRLERRPSPDRRDVDLSALLRDTVEGFGPVAAASESRLKLTTDSDLHVQGDAAALQQLVLNLLDNAVKYGPRGQTVRIRAMHSVEGALLTVEDEGSGVPECDRRLVWQAYWRGSGSAQGGSGIGLAIVEHTARMHAGRAWVDDAEAGGACFNVVLPLHAAGSLESALQSASRPA